MSDIMERLKKLGVSKGIPETYEIRPKPLNAFSALQKTFPNGICAENDFGPYFLNRMTQPADQLHGKVDLSLPLSSSPLFDAIMGTTDLRAESILAMDTETSGLSHASAAFVFMIGMGYISGDQYVVDQLILPDLCYEKAFLRQIELTFGRFSTLITYNGSGFDVPMIQSRSSFYLFPDFCKKPRHIDLLSIARRYWKRNLGSVRLSNIEQYVLRLERGIEETPGSLAPELYRQYLSDFDASHISGVSYHNRVDVVSLYAFLRLINELCAYSAETPEIWENNNASLSQVIKYNTKFLPKEILLKYGNFDKDDKKDIASHAFREKDFLRAAELYEELAESGDADCAIKASQIFHKLRNTEKEEHFRQLALELIEKDPSVGIWSKKRIDDMLTGKKTKMK